MTTMTGFGNQKLITDQTELRQAREVVDQAASVHLDRWVAAGADGVSITLPRELSEMITKILRIVARGDAVTVSSMPKEVTTTVAADMLGVSRPTLMKMVAQGALPATKVGSHTRLRPADVVEFRRARLEGQRAAFDELLRIEDEQSRR